MEMTEISNVDMSINYDIAMEVLRKLWNEKYDLEEGDENLRKDIVFKNLLKYFSHEKRNFKLSCAEWIYREDLFDLEEDDKYQCICSHLIHQLFFIENVINHNILMVGCDCVLKIPNNPKLIRGIMKHKKRKDYENKSKNPVKRQCKECLNMRISENCDPLIKLCKSCFLDNKQKLQDNYYYLSEKQKEIIRALQDHYLPRKQFLSDRYKKKYYNNPNKQSIKDVLDNIRLKKELKKITEIKVSDEEIPKQELVNWSRKQDMEIKNLIQRLKERHINN
jgi:hypothetical protein